MSYSTRFPIGTRVGCFRSSAARANQTSPAENLEELGVIPVFPVRDVCHELGPFDSFHPYVRVDEGWSQQFGNGFIGLQGVERSIHGPRKGTWCVAWELTRALEVSEVVVGRAAWVDSAPDSV